VQYLAVEDEFKEFDQSNPNCVVLGDATTAFTYPRLNSAFRLLLQQPGLPLITMGVGYIQHCLYFKLTRWLSGVMIRRTKTYDQQVVGSVPGQVAIKWLLLRWATICRQINHLCI